jgi:hypothetical protein
MGIQPLGWWDHLGVAETRAQARKIALSERSVEMAGTRHRLPQISDAGEMLIAAELILHGVPAFIAPDFWPGCDVIAQPTHPGTVPQRVQVKTRTYEPRNAFVGYDEIDEFDWLAIVILPGPGCDRRRFFIVPRKIADARGTTENRTWRKKRPERAPGRSFFVRNVVKFPDEHRQGLADYEDNFGLSQKPPIRPP